MTLRKTRILKWANKVLDEKGFTMELPTGNQTQRLVFLNKSRGVYSGVSQITTTHQRLDGEPTTTTDTYGFVLDFANHTFHIDSASGNMLKPTATVLKKVFPSDDTLLASDSHTAKMLGFFSKAFGQFEFEMPNAGRGIYRALTKFYYAESFYKDIILDKQGEISSWVKRYTDTRRSYYTQVWTLAGLYKALLNLRPKERAENPTYSFRKDLGFSKNQFNKSKDLFLRLKGGEGSDARLSWIPFNHRLAPLVFRITPMMEDITAKYHTYQTLEEMQQALLKEHYRLFAYSYELGGLKDIIDMLERDNPKYNLRRLMEYLIVDLVTHQGISDIEQAISLLKDYYQLAFDDDKGKFLGGKSFIKFPKYLKVAHDISSRNFQEIHETKASMGVAVAYHKHANDWEGVFKIKGKEYTVLMPRSSAEIVAEGQSQSNCVGGYSRKVASGDTFILSMRQANKPENTWITIEVTPENYYAKHTVLSIMKLLQLKLRY